MGGLTSEDADITSWTPRKSLSLAVFMVFALLICTVLLIEVKSVVLTSPGEILNHIFASGGFTVAASGVLLLFRQRPSALTIMLTGTAITVALEAAQALAPARDAEIDDLISGLSGVLLAALVLEAVFQLSNHRVSLRLHLVAATLGSIVLTVLLLFTWSPGTVRTASPDGTPCPTTQVDPAGSRLTIGSGQTVTNDCLLTESGGLGVLGRWADNGSFDRTVLLTSTLDPLRDNIPLSGQLRLAFEIVTGDMPSGPYSTIAILRTPDGRHVLHVRVTKHRLEITGPNLRDSLPATVTAHVLEPNSRYDLDVLLTSDAIDVRVNDENVGHTAINSGWNEDLDAESLQLLIGNNAHRSRPFHGVIEWIDIDA